jgi:hypothetical protein
MLSWHRIIVLAALAVTTALTSWGCGHSSNKKGDEADDPRSGRFVLIDAKRLPDAVVQRVTLKELEEPNPADIAQMRDTVCDGEAVEMIFYQLVVSRDWHYYWLCSESESVRAMTRRGEKKLSQWLSQLETKAQQKLADCAAGSSKRILSEQHESGIIAHVYCDNVLMLAFPDGGEQSLKLGKTSVTQRLKPREQPGPAPTTQATKPGKCECPPCPKATVCPTVAKSCRAYGEKAFWLGVRKACNKICPSIYNKCRKANPKGSLCHQLSEYCATLRGLCVR